MKAIVVGYGVHLRLTFILSCAVSTAFAADFSGEQTLASFKNYCADCHSGTKSKGQFDLNKLSADVANLQSIYRWQRILTRVESGEMPPPGETRPPPNETNAVLNWVKENLASELHTRRANEGHTFMRRLNRLEYENTLHDLLGIHTPLQEILPPDSSANGFDTAASALRISPVHISQYMEAAEIALNAALVRTTQPQTKITRLYLVPEKEQTFMDYAGNKPMIRPRNGELIFFSEPHVRVPAKLKQFADITQNQSGRYRVRVSCYTYDAQSSALTFSIRTAHRQKLLGYFDAPAGKPVVVEVESYFEPGDTIILSPYHLNEARGDRGLSQYPARPWSEPDGLGLAIQWVEVEGPVHEIWPPVGYRALFGNLPLMPFRELPAETVLPADLEKLRKSDKLTASAENKSVDSRSLLAAFLARIFRRPVKDYDIQPYQEIVTRHLEKKECFESAMLAAYQAALCSPEFLFLVEPDGNLDDHALASRLSYFLWRSAPDEMLRALADRGELRKGDVLRRETERLLNSPRVEAFVNDFLDQWLHLKEINNTVPDQQLYPEFYERADSATIDCLLRDSLPAETRLFFGDLLKADGNLLQLVDSNFTYLNSRLAKHYGLPAVDGSALRRVTIPADSVRGGVMTQASVLKVTANGSVTSPVLRGAWMLDNILGRKPLPPPPIVGAIEPDTRGATNIREQLDRHRNNESCALCHRQIDPPGFAMECFDAVGEARTFYRTTETGKRLDATRYKDGSRKLLVKYFQGVDVDSKGETASGKKFSGPKEFKQLVLQQPELVARNLAAKLLTYSTGQATEPGDILMLDAMVQRLKVKNYGLRSLIHEVVKSELFLKK